MGLCHVVCCVTLNLSLHLGFYSVVMIMWLCRGFIWLLLRFSNLFPSHVYFVSFQKSGLSFSLLSNFAVGLPKLRIICWHTLSNYSLKIFRLGLSDQ